MQRLPCCRHGNLQKLILNGVFTRTYVRWETDIIFISSIQCAMALSTVELFQKKLWYTSTFNKKCRHIAISQDRTITHLLPQLILGTHFPNLVELIFVREGFVSNAARRRSKRRRRIEIVVRLIFFGFQVGRSCLGLLQLPI